MKIQLFNSFHQTSSDIFFSTSNKEIIQLSGRKIRKALGELCFIKGCDCLESLTITIDGTPAKINWIDPDAEDEASGIEIKFPEGFPK